VADGHLRVAVHVGHVGVQDCTQFDEEILLHFGFKVAVRVPTLQLLPVGRIVQLGAHVLVEEHVELETVAQVGGLAVVLNLLERGTDDVLTLLLVLLLLQNQDVGKHFNHFGGLELGIGSECLQYKVVPYFGVPVLLPLLYFLAEHKYFGVMVFLLHKIQFVSELEQE